MYAIVRVDEPDFPVDFEDSKSEAVRMVQLLGNSFREFFTIVQVP